MKNLQKIIVRTRCELINDIYELIGAIEIITYSEELDTLIDKAITQAVKESREEMKKKDYRKIVFVTDKGKNAMKLIRENFGEVIGYSENYYGNGWLCERCGTFFAQRTKPKKCWKCEEDYKNGMSCSPGWRFKPI